MSLLELANRIAALSAIQLVVFLIGIEAEIAILRALEGNEEGNGPLAGPASQAAGRYPSVSPAQALAAILACPRRIPEARTPRLRLLPLEGEAEIRNGSLVISSHLVKRGFVFRQIHAIAPDATHLQHPISAFFHGKPSRGRNAARAGDCMTAGGIHPEMIK